MPGAPGAPREKVPNPYPVTNMPHLIRCAIAANDNEGDADIWYVTVPPDAGFEDAARQRARQLYGVYIPRDAPVFTDNTTTGKHVLAMHAWDEDSLPQASRALLSYVAKCVTLRADLDVRFEVGIASYLSVASWAATKAKLPCGAEALDYAPPYTYVAIKVAREFASRLKEASETNHQRTSLTLMQQAYRRMWPRRQVGNEDHTWSLELGWSLAEQAFAGRNSWELDGNPPHGFHDLPPLPQFSADFYHNHQQPKLP